MNTRDSREEMIRLARRILDELESEDTESAHGADGLRADSVRLARLAHPDRPRVISRNEPRVVELQIRERQRREDLATLEEIDALLEMTLEDPLTDPNFDVDFVFSELRSLSGAVLKAARNGLQDAGQLAAPAVLLAQFVTYLDKAMKAGQTPRVSRRAKSG